MRRLITLFVSLGLCLSAFSQTITIGDTGDFPTLSSASGSLTPGVTVLFQTQDFDDGAQFLYNVSGTADQPITLKSQVMHGAVFQGGSESIHLRACSHIIIDGFVIEEQTGNGMNLDDGGTYNVPATNITVRNCIFRDMNVSGNNDFLKMSGIDSFLIENCQFINGSTGSGAGIDFVGCHYGTIQDCYFDNTGYSGVQNKGGTHNVLIRRNVFKNISQRAIHIGGSTGLAFFRPPLPNPIVDAFEASEIFVFANVFIDCWAPIAYTGAVDSHVSNNTFYMPENWVIRILQENTTPGFLTCSDNSFTNNIIYLASDIVEANIGPDTNPSSFTISHNLWYNASDINWQPNMPVADPALLVADPLFTDVNTENFLPQSGSPALASGADIFSPDLDFLAEGFNTPPSRGAYEISPITGQAHIDVQNNCIEVFPNPFISNIKITGNFSNAQMHIMDASGQVFQNLTGVNSPYTINLFSLPPGIYIIRIESEIYNQLYLEKILKW